MNVNCSLCRKSASAYLDFQVGEDARAEMEYHLAVCPGCQAHVRELKGVRTALGGLAERSVPAEYSLQWMEALSRAASRPAKTARRAFDWREWFSAKHPMLAGYGVGFVVTSFLFFGILVSFKPVLRWTAPEYNIVYIKTSPNSPTATVMVPAAEAPPDTHSNLAFSAPTIEAQGVASSALPDALFLSNENGGVVLIAEVSPQGKARLLQMESPPRDPQVAAAVGEVLRRISFRPATEFGRPVQSRVVLLMEQIYVRG